jgi:hypothetical protein
LLLLLLVLFLPLPRQLLVVLDVGERDVAQHARCNTPKRQELSLIGDDLS